VVKQGIDQKIRLIGNQLRVTLRFLSRKNSKQCLRMKRWRARAGAGKLRPAKQNHPASSPSTNCSNCMVRLSGTIFYESTLLAISCIEYLRGTT